MIMANARSVCHMTSAHASNDIRIMKKECTTLAEAGYKVTLAAKGESGRYENVDIAGIGTVTGGRLRRFLLVSRQIYKKALELNADIYHFHDPELLPYAWKLKKYGKKVIYDSHEYMRDQIKTKSYIPRGLRSLISAVFGCYEDFVIGKLDAVIFPTPMGGSTLFKTAREIVYVNNYPHLGEKALFTEVSQTPKENAVCYVGSLSYERGIYHLIKACHLAGVRLVLAGKFSSREFMEQVQKMPEYSCVEYLGQVERKQVYEIYSRCLIGASTLLNVGQYYKLDNLPTKVYEYMTMKMPSILSDSPYNKTAVEEYRFGMTVNPEDPEEIAAAIGYLLTHKEEATEMGLRGASLVEEKFCWEKEAESLLDLYCRLTGEGTE